MGPPAFSAEKWFASRGWTPHAFQREAWTRFRNGESGLIHVPTGSGKTYAAYLAALEEIVAGRPRGAAVIYVSPLRAVARDIELALRSPVEECGLAVTVGSRTGDTDARERARQREMLPNVLVTTPESLTLLVASERVEETLGGVRAVIVDKDNDPKWNPANAEGVSEELLDAIFAPLPPQEEWKPL